jgi:hypothetical protein
MAGFLFRLETPDGVPAEPPKLASAVPNWRAGDTIPLGRRMLRVVGVTTTRMNPRCWSSRTWPNEPIAWISHGRGYGGLWPASEIPSHSPTTDLSCPVLRRRLRVEPSIP